MTEPLRASNEACKIAGPGCSPQNPTGETGLFPEYPPCRESTRTWDGKALALNLLAEPGRPRIRRRTPRDRRRIPEPLAAALGDCVTGRRPWPLFVTGPAGCGKTCGALCLADRVPGRSIHLELSALAETVRRALFAGPGTADDLWDEWRRASFGILDELGIREHVSDHVYAVAKTALDVRERRPLIVLSNIGLDRIAELFDDRVASRCAAGTVIDLAGYPDQRIARLKELA
jgi:hypothetical protein